MDAKTKDYGWREEASHTEGYIRPAILAIARARAPRDVLDAGCGNGALAQALVAEGYTVMGVDGDAGGIAFARAKCPRSRFEVVNFADDPTALQATSDGRFDMVVSTEVIEHLYSPHDLVRFCFDALRTGGTLAISTPYHGYLKNLALALTDKWDSHFTTLWHGGHIKFWSRKTLTQLLSEHGFEVVGFTGVGRFPYFWKSMILTARKP